MRPELSVILPMFATRFAVPELIDRLDRSLAPFGAVELVFVDDACPERSYEAVLAHPATRADVLVVRHERNHGQHAAVISGLRHASGRRFAVMDADLQDEPEELPRLVQALIDATNDVGGVAAGRAGRYEARHRLLTARLFRRAMSLLTRGRIPSDAALFLVMSETSRARVLELRDPAVHLVAALGRTGARLTSLPVRRRTRPSGASSYDSWRRLAAAAGALVVLTPAYALVRPLRRRRHGYPIPARVLRREPDHCQPEEAR